jgi:hypothetical protein
VFFFICITSHAEFLGPEKVKHSLNRLQHFFLQMGQYPEFISDFKYVNFLAEKQFSEKNTSFLKIGAFGHNCFQKRVSKVNYIFLKSA